MIPLRVRTAVAAALAALALAHAAPAAAQDTLPPPEELVGRGFAPLPQPEADAVRAVVTDYIAAAARRDGTAAARLVGRATRDYYGRLATMAVSAPEAQVRAAPLMERMLVLMYRHRVPAADLRALAAGAAFAHTIDQGWVNQDPDAARLLAQAPVYGKGDEAVIWAGGGGVYFVREDGGWRWDMMPTLLAAAEALAPPPDSGMTEDEFVAQVLTFSTGRAPSPDIWQPLP